VYNLGSDDSDSEDGHISFKTVLNYKTENQMLKFPENVFFEKLHIAQTKILNKLIRFSG
jgi:hypothetical protein